MGKIIAFSGRMRSGKTELSNICEKEGFSPVYYTLERSKYNGSKYKVLGRRHGLNYPAWVIEFANGVKMLAYAEEIIPHEMKARGCLYSK